MNARYIQRNTIAASAYLQNADGKGELSLFSKERGKTNHT